VPMSFISEAEIERLTGDPYHGWRAFWEQYPDAQGILTLSSVAFDRDMSRALVYAGNQSGADMGKGFYLILGRGESGWHIEQWVPMWVS
jgi:hypothetical protein